MPLHGWPRFVWAILFGMASVASGNQGTPNQPAPGSLKNLSLEQLSQIEVTSPSKEPTPAMKSPVAIYVITGEDIRRSGVTTIPDALRMAPGVEVAQIDASKWSIGIRGFGTRLSRSVLVLIDGRTVYTPLFAGTYWEVQDTLLEDIDRIEVIRGPGGIIWGPNAVDGVINIISKSTKDTQGAYASVGGGNQEQGFFNSRYGGARGDLTYRLYGKGFTRGPEYHPDHDNFDDWRGVQGGFRMDWTRGNRDAFTLQGDIYKQADGERVGLATYTPPANLVLDGNEDLSGGNVLFQWKHTASAGNDFQLQAYYDRTNRQEPNLGENRDTTDIDLLKRTKWGDRQELIYGAGARVSAGRFHEVGSGLVFAPLHRTDYLFSAFFEDDINLVNDRLMLTAGTKLLHTNYIHGIDFEPSIRLMWTPTAKQTFWASFTHALRTPSDAEEDFYLSSLIGFSNGTPVFARFNGNPLYAPEKLNAWRPDTVRFFARICTSTSPASSITTTTSSVRTSPAERRCRPRCPSLPLRRRPHISCFPRNSRTTSTARPTAVKSHPNGGRPTFGDCAAPTHSCACPSKPRRRRRSLWARAWIRDRAPSTRSALTRVSTFPGNYNSI